MPENASVGKELLIAENLLATARRDHERLVEVMRVGLNGHEHFDGDILVAVRQALYRMKEAYQSYRAALRELNNLSDWKDLAS